MINLEKRILRELYEKYGGEIIFNPKRLRAYLLDMHVQKKTVNLLVDISRATYFKQFAEDLKDDLGAVEKLKYNTECEYAFEKAAVKYGVDCWVYALTDNPPNAGGNEDNTYDCEIWPDEKAELVAAALRELLK